MEKKKIIFIVNPISGTKAKDVIIDDIEQIIDKQRFEYEIKRTQYKGHAAEYAKEAAQNGADIVVAIGGDGTVNEVARSLINTNTALGIIPCGSGNGLARHLQIPMESKKAIALINQANIKALDYGIINDLPFFCTCGVGFDAFVSLKFAEAGKRGLLTYLENTLIEGLRYKPETYIIQDENGEVKYNAFLIACANASQYGNNAYIAPDASMSDGLMDVTIMEPFNTLEAPQIAIQLFSKTLNSNSHIKTFKAKKIRIVRQSEGAVHCDGDPITTNRNIDVEMIEKGLLVVINKDSKQQSHSILQIFSDYFNDLSSIEGGIFGNKQQLRRINKVLLKKLSKK